MIIILAQDVKKALIITDVGGTRTAPELKPKVATIHNLASEACHVHGLVFSIATKMIIIMERWINYTIV